jgi:hypothetical protein
MKLLNILLAVLVVLLVGVYVLTAGLVYVTLSEKVTQTIRDEIAELRTTLPATDDVYPRVDYPAGSDVPEWRLIVGYRVQSYMDAVKLERKIRGMME